MKFMVREEISYNGKGYKSQYFFSSQLYYFQLVFN